MDGISISPMGAYAADEVLRLYEAVGWTNYTRRPEMLRRAVEGSLLVLEARHNGRLVGLVRAVGDGASILYIQDLLVLPEYNEAVLRAGRNIENLAISTVELVSLYEVVSNATIMMTADAVKNMEEAFAE